MKSNIDDRAAAVQFPAEMTSFTSACRAAPEESRGVGPQTCLMAAVHRRKISLWRKVAVSTTSWRTPGSGQTSTSDRCPTRRPSAADCVHHNLLRHNCFRCRSGGGRARRGVAGRASAAAAAGTDDVVTAAASGSLCCRNHQCDDRHE